MLAHHLYWLKAPDSLDDHTFQLQYSLRKLLLLRITEFARKLLLPNHPYVGQVEDIHALRVLCIQRKDFLEVLLLCAYAYSNGKVGVFHTVLCEMVSEVSRDISRAPPQRKYLSWVDFA